MLKIKTTDLGGVFLLALAGHIDFGNGDVALNKAVRDALGQGRKRIVINMKGVDLIDSAGLGTLAGLSISSRRQKAIIKLAELSPFVKGILETTSLHLKYDVYPTENEAIASFVKEDGGAVAKT